MWGNYLKIAFRNLIRNRVFSAINIFGLAIGMAGCIILMLWIEDELNYDIFLENKNEIYRVMSYGTRYMQEGFDGSPAPLSLFGREMIPEIINSTTFEDVGEVLIKYEDHGFYEKGGLVVDTTFFDMFSFKILKGDPETFFDDPYSIVISENMAEKYFGSVDVLGKVMETSGLQIKVTGVISDIPLNSTLQFDYVVPFTLYQEFDYPFSWGRFMYATYVQIGDNANVDTVASKLTEVARSQNCPQVLDGVSFTLQTMDAVHLDGKHNIWRPFYKSVDKRYIFAFSIIAVFILLIACMNYINLTTARAERRSREVGLRKVVGADRRKIINQFLGESMLVTLISIIIALILVELIRPGFNVLTDKQLIINYTDWTFMLGVIVIFLVTGLMAGSYPAFILSYYNPIKVLKGLGRGGSGGSAFRRVLVVFQFVIASGLIIGSIVIYQQMRFIRNKNLCFEKEHVVYIPLKENLGKEYKYVKNELLNDPNILSVSAASYLSAFDNNRCSGCFTWDGYTDENEVDFIQMTVDFDYFKTLGIPLVDGRAFSSEYSTDSTLGFMVNESAVKDIGVNNVLGLSCKYGGYNSTLRSGQVIGIFKDVHSRSLRHEIDPKVVWIMQDPGEHDSRGVMLVKINGAQVGNAIQSLEELWNKINRITPFEFHFLDRTYEELYSQDRRIGQIVLYFTILAIIISCLGIFGLAAFMAERRTKEIGVRKVNGAGIGNIVWLMSKEFSRWVIIAFIIACPLAWYFMDKVLNNYAYRIDIGAGIFIIAFLMVFIIAFVSVGYQAFKVARANPVEALRYE